MIVLELIGQLLLFVLISQMVMGGLAAVIVLHWLMMRRLETTWRHLQKRGIDHD